MESSVNFQDLEYCNFVDYKLMKEIFGKAFSINDFGEIEKAYEIFKDNFTSNIVKEGFVVADRNNFIPITTDKLFLDKFQNKDYNVGVDLPVYIKHKEKNNGKCVFIVGEDPLRTGLNDLSIILSTPYATHYKVHREGRNGQLYWGFSNYLLGQGYSLYYTDVKKIWIKGKKERMKLEMPIDLLAHFRNSLKEEVEKFKPATIITFGKDAKESIEQIGIRQHISFLHPTFSARRHWKNKYNWPSATNEKVFSQMCNEFSTKIHYSNIES